MNITLAKYLTIGCTVAAIVVPLTSEAQGRPSGPPLDKIAADLNVSEAALKTCMPAPTQGQRPERPDPASLASCLQADNAFVTQASVSAVLEANRPERGQRGN